MGHSIIALWVGAGLGRGAHFAKLLCYTQFALVADGGTSVIPRTRCLVSSLDNRPLSSSRSQLTSAVSPAR